MAGHGHVTPNPDGSKARCGGPAICAECAREAAQLAADTPARPPGIYIHPRTHIVQKAGLDIGDAVLKVIRDYELTDAEIAGILAEQILRWNKYAIRHERHPDEPGKGGDEE
jgi:hypothetical protein